MLCLLDSKERTHAVKGTITERILADHLVGGELEPGQEIAIRIDQTLTQDATGTMAYLQFEALGLDRVRTELSVSYVDHNTLQAGFESADDHRFLQTVAAKRGLYFSRPGNGICHQVHLERFGRPGKTLLGSDSHTPTGGGLGMIALGAGGLDVALAMAGLPFYLRTPQVLGVTLVGQLPDWVSAHDVILHLLAQLSVSGGVGKVMEYGGPGIAGLNVPQRATITNMGAELGATTSVFPVDEVTRGFLRAQQREEHWLAIEAEAGAQYEEEITVDLSAVVPMIAQPHSPDNVVPAAELTGMPVDQVCIGSCTNSSYQEMMTVAAVLRGKKIAEGVSLTISPGSRQVLEMLARNGALADMIAAGARILESACGPCIGMGQAPTSGAITVRSFNRNFPGRSGTPSAGIYLASPVVCAVTALAGKLTDPRTFGAAPRLEIPERFGVDDAMIVPPAAEPEQVEVYHGPNIKPVPRQEPLADTLRGEILLKVDDNISTDDILPAGAKVLPLRSNIPAISRYVFARIDEGFADRAEAQGGGMILGGRNYGQGSSREHAALAPAYLGVKAVLAVSFARIHHANLVNFGVLPAEIAPEDHERCQQGDELCLSQVRSSLERGDALRVQNLTRGFEFSASCALAERQVAVMLAGGALNWAKEQVGSP